MSENKYVCIHGHFYQPPRENAWLEVIEMQDSAKPFHDWNERINYECYQPNTAARILNEQNFIVKIVNNYSRISFNFGPTLLTWLEKKAPQTYQAILKADQISITRFGGHGNALAQVHGHLIMPLCNARDKETQVKWGIEDFRHRFKRKPEGIWLAETAVDTDTLEVLADHDIKFTILAPNQAKAFKQIHHHDWTHIGNGIGIDPRRPYWCNLPSGRKIALFFYDGNISQGVAFKGLLKNGKDYAGHILSTLDGGNDYPQLAHVGTDGESYGHHHRYGEMALAACLHEIEESSSANLINYGYYLEKFPPAYEAMIHENSSWSCAHGVERWRSNCGCHTGGGPGWHQAWRAPLRDALNWVRDELIPLYETEGEQYLTDVWAARNDYIKVLTHDRSPQAINNFLEKYKKRPLEDYEETLVLRLLEMQRHAMLMFTSCGWFFNEISGLETDQILQYANRAISYAYQISGINLHDDFIKKLEAAPSNVHENGAVSYKKNVLPAKVDLQRVAMHYAASSLFKDKPSEGRFFNYTVKNEVLKKYKAGLQRMCVGRTTIQSEVTRSEQFFSFVVLYLGQQNIFGNITLDISRVEFDKMHQKVEEAFHSTDLGKVIGVMQHYLQSDTFTIWHLFRDEKRNFLQKITEQSLQHIERSYREIFNDNYQLMTSMQENQIPVPEAYMDAARYVINADLRDFFEDDLMPVRELQRLSQELKKWEVKVINKSSFKLKAEDRLLYECKKVANGNVSVEYLKKINTIIKVLKEIGAEPDLSQVQNIYFRAREAYRHQKLEIPSEAWKEAFNQLGNLLKVKSLA